LLFLFLLEPSLPWEDLALDMLLVILISGSSNDSYNSCSDRAQWRRQVMVMVMKIFLLSFQISSFLDDDGGAWQQWRVMAMVTNKSLSSLLQWQRQQSTGASYSDGNSNGNKWISLLSFWQLRQQLQATAGNGKMNLSLSLARQSIS
jgi:hypothetical protein